MFRSMHRNLLYIHINILELDKWAAPLWSIPNTGRTSCWFQVSYLWKEDDIKVLFSFYKYYDTDYYSYRPGAGSHFHTENHRPASAYIPGLSYRSRYDGDHGNYTTHRRSFYDGITDPQRPITPNNELGATTYAPAGVAPPDSPEGRDGSGGIFSRFRPVTRRLVGTALRDVDGRRARSQSNDHMYSTVLAREDAEFASM